MRTIIKAEGVHCAYLPGLKNRGSVDLSWTSLGQNRQVLVLVQKVGIELNKEVGSIYT